VIFGYKDNPTNKDTILGPEGILITGFYCITELEGEIEDNEDTIIVDQGPSIRDSESRAMELKRDQIAEKMWLDYQGYINNTK
jgi:hypothetical protein